MSFEKTYTEQEAAKLLTLSMMTLKRLRKSKSIGYYQIGRRVTYGEQHLQEFLSANEQKKRL